MVPPTPELLLQLSLIIVVAKVAGDLAVRARLSAVLGELLAGVALGPTLLGLKLNNDVITFVADVGVILLLLEVGLATNPRAIREVGRLAFAVASLGVVASFLLGTFVTLALARSPLAALLMGTALASTSIGITARVFQDMGKVQSPEARVVIAAALFDDVMGLVLLSILSGVAQGAGVDALGIARVIVLSLAFVALPLLFGQRAGRRLVGLVDRGRVRGVFTALVFVAALVLAALAFYIGLSVFLGGFAAGLIFASTEKRVHLEERMKPLADLFVPVFFVLIGSLADLRSLAGPPVLLLVAALLGTAIVGKLMAGLGSLRSRARPLRVGVSMIPRLEVALVVASVAAFPRQGPPAWDQGLYSALLVVVLLTTLLTPLLVRLAFREGRARAPAPPAAPFPRGENVPFEESGENEEQGVDSVATGPRNK